MRSLARRFDVILPLLALLVVTLGAPVTYGGEAGQTSTQPSAIAQTHLKVGDVAPDFTLLSDQWQPVKLSDFRGKKNVILAIYVLAFTPG